MNQTVLILIIVLAVVIVIVLFAYLHKSTSITMKTIWSNSSGICSRRMPVEISKVSIHQELKEKYKCTQKEALYLLGLPAKTGS